MSDPEHITYWLTLDALTFDRAVYVGADHMAATIDRATFDSQGRPTRVTLRVPKVVDAE